MSNSPKIVYGGYPFGLLPHEDSSKIVEVLKKSGIRELDTARIYPGSEKAIGELHLPEQFVIDTKARGFTDGSLTKKGIEESIAESLDLLGVESVEIFYLHCPDRDTEIEETIDAINELHQQGKFKKFGLSNFPAKDVEQVYNYAKSKGYVLPTVYQGNYNAVARRSESELFPLLRKLNIAFYAYSPIAGGFLARSVDDIKNGEGRFDPNTPVGQIYLKLYSRPALLTALDEWDKLAQKVGTSKARLAYRWVVHNSVLSGKFGDAVIIGGRNADQVTDTAEAISEGPLPANIVSEIDKLWEKIKDEAPLDNYSF